MNNLLVIAVSLLLLWIGTGCRTSPATARPNRNSVLFKDVAAKIGIRFTHTNGARGNFHMIETSGSGCGFFDFDNDGDLDILLLDCGPLPGNEGKAQNHLYRNESGRRFTNITTGSGLETAGYAQGMTIGDYDNDGFDDLYVTAYGGNHLYRNDNGTGRFLDVTSQAGVSDRDQGNRYATSAAFGDYDNDGWLDLYVCHYCIWKPSLNKQCKNSHGERDYCSPEVYDPDSHRLYRNLGNGTFQDVTTESGIAKAKGRGFAAAWLDYNNDGKQDLFVANDLNPQFLWKNLDHRRFQEVALEAGCAFSDLGTLISGMGVGVGDYNNDGREDLFVTNFSGQPNTLWRNEGNGRFSDVSYPIGVAIPHMKYLAFGCEFFDYDADGWKDLIVSNGHVQTKVESTFEGVTYKERKQLFRNEKGKLFKEVVRNAGDLDHRSVGRGLAVGDYDNDGRLDVLINNQNGRAELFRNQVVNDPKDSENGITRSNHWISFKLIGTKSNRSGYHAKVTVRAGGRTQFSQVRAGSSYASQSDSRLYFGLGPSATAADVDIRWPSGSRTALQGLQADRIYMVKEGVGITGVRGKDSPPTMPLHKI